MASRPLIRHLCSLLFLASGSATAATSSSNSASTSLVISTGDGGSGAKAATVTPDLFSGSFSYPIPIEVLPGRQDMKPDLFVTYRSGGANSWLGMGWSLDLGGIERNLESGVDFGGDAYVLTGSEGASKLTSVAPGEYRSLIEGSFTRVRKLTAPDGRPCFEATSRTGLKYTYGSSAASRQDDPASPGRIFGWRLDRIEDPNGNYMTVSHWKDQGAVYPERIDYAGSTAGLIPGNSVRFVRELRPDADEGYRVGFKVRTAWRLRKIGIYAGANPVRWYLLGYATSRATGRSVLSSLKQYGSDMTDAGGLPTGTSLPGTTIVADNGTNSIAQQTWLTTAGPWGYAEYTKIGDFDGDGRADIATIVGSTIYVYRSGGAAFQPRATWTTIAGPWGYGSYTWVADFDGDGKSDIATVVSNVIYVYRSTGSSFRPREVWSTDAGPWVDQQDTFTWTGDFNGDGKTDIATAAFETITVYRSMGTHFRRESWSTTAGPWGYAEYTWTGDFDGDGRADIATATGGTIYVQRSIGTAFSQETWTTAAPHWGYGQYTWAADFDGDGKNDIATAIQGTIYVKRSTGAAFVEEVWTTSAPNWGYGYNGPNGGYTWTGDFNGDGRADIATAIQGTIYVKRSTGATFIEEKWTTAAPSWGYGVYTWAADFSGDGRTDIATVNQNLIYVKKTSSFPVDLVTEIRNGYSGRFSIGYTPSPAFANTLLPFPVQVVSSITSADGTGLSATSSLVYAGGYYHIGERDFRGFAYVRVTNPAASNGAQLINETWYHQGNSVAFGANDPSATVGYMRGRPYLVRVTDALTSNRRDVETDYQADADAKAPWFAPTLEVRSKTYEGGAVVLSTRAAYSCDEYGNIVREDQYGDEATSADDRTVTRTFSPNTAAWILGLPWREDIYQGIGTTNLVARRSFYYDGVPTVPITATDTERQEACSVASTNQQPTRGNLTRTVSWNDNGPSPEARIGYDLAGNVVCTRDGRGYVSTVRYDTTATFPVSSKNPLGHTTSTAHYGVDGVLADKGLYGLKKSVTDPNGAMVTTEYDPLGRPVRRTSPGASRLDGTEDVLVTTWAYNNLGTLGSQVVNGDQHVRTANSLGGWTEAYFDGLQRPIGDRRAGPPSKTIASRRSYDARGAVASESLPYFEGLETPRYKTMKYDSWGRVIESTSPSGTARACYGGTVTVRLDEMGHRRRETGDAGGRLVRVEEYLGTYSSCTTALGSPYAATAYEFDVLGRLRFVTDARLNKTELRYDSLGRKKFLHDPDMGDVEYGYDENGNLAWQLDANGRSHPTPEYVRFEHDALNRVTLKTYPNGVANIYVYDETTARNPIGRLTTTIDASGTARYDYDKSGRTAVFSRTVDNVTRSLLTAYDGLGRVSAVAYPDEIVGYSYDLAGNLFQVGTYASYGEFNALGLPGTAGFGNGVTTTYRYYDATDSRLKSIVTATAAQTFMSLAYSYDAAGNVKTITDQLDGTRSQSFDYDELNRLVRAQSTAYGVLAYAYDQIGNFRDKEGVTFTYGARPHAVSTTSDGRTFAYDSNGNMLSDGMRTLGYDYDNRPMAVALNGVTTSLVYDGSGRRVKKIATAGTVVYFDKLLECTGAACGKYIFAGNSRIAIRTGSDVKYYHSNHLGSTTVVTSTPAGTDPPASLEGIFYRPYGATVSDSGVVSVNHKFTGQELDPETGLYYYGARYYDPSLGRFISPDSVIADVTQPQQLNRYSYALNNPLFYTDPSGHNIWDAVKDFFDSKLGKLLTAAAIIVGTAMTGGALAVGALIGEGFGALTGAYSAYKAAGGWDWNAIANGILAGTIAGGVTGAAAAYASGLVGGFGSFWGSVGNGALRGAVGGLGMGIAGGYQGGAGNWTATFWEDVAFGVGAGAVLGGIVGGVAYDPGPKPSLSQIHPNLRGEIPPTPPSAEASPATDFSLGRVQGMPPPSRPVGALPKDLAVNAAKDFAVAAAKHAVAGSTAIQGIVVTAADAALVVERGRIWETLCEVAPGKQPTCRL